MSVAGTARPHPLRTVTVELGERSYPVVVGRGALTELTPLGRELAAGDSVRAALVTQTPVADHARRVARRLEAAGLAVEVLTVPDGEQAKSLAVLGDLYRRLAALPLGRRDVVVAVGGGVVGDLAGFVAATWHRGVRVVQVPTSLVAQVDAAIGGKTAINLPAGKNLVGAFHQPVAVIADVDTLASLGRRELVAGLAEVVKYGLIRDPSILQTLDRDPEAAAAGAPPVMADLVVRSAAVKAAVVAADEHDAGQRAHLNLGHTYGHALEALTGFSRWRHGEAVAVGLCVALRLGARLGLTPRTLIGRTERLLAALDLPTRAPRLDRGRVWAAMTRDKKARGQVRFVLVEALGRPTVTTPPADAVDAAIDEVEQPG